MAKKYIQIIVQKNVCILSFRKYIYDTNLYDNTELNKRIADYKQYILYTEQNTLCLSLYSGILDDINTIRKTLGYEIPYDSQVGKTDLLVFYATYPASDWGDGGGGGDVCSLI